MNKSSMTLLAVLIHMYSIHKLYLVYALEISHTLMPQANVLAVPLLTTGMLTKEPVLLALLVLSTLPLKENVSAQPQLLT
jgi:hypothetical protein